MKTSIEQTIFSLSQAAKATGKSKSVLSKALKSGTLSYVAKNTKGYQIQASELFRAFPQGTGGNTNIEQLETPKSTEENRLKIRELELEVNRLNKENAFYENQLEKVETNCNEWKEQLKISQRLLGVEVKEKQNGFFARVFSKNT
jgi:uncharacterized protein YhaN